MDDIAAAAGVGKGTLFRAFGSRDGLLDALFAERMARLRAAVEEGDPPLGPQAPPRERVLAVLDAILLFKLENAPLNALRPDLIDELLASGNAPEQIRAAQAALARRILG
jgi:AcrR family transcriptional regulator